MQPQPSDYDVCLLQLRSAGPLDALDLSVVSLSMVRLDFNSFLLLR